MTAKIRRVEYFYATVADQPGEGYRVLGHFAQAGVNLLAFNAIPVGPAHTQFVMFTDEVTKLQRVAAEAKMTLVGPQRAFLVNGDDELGALVDIHRKLYEADLNVFASSGVTDGRGGYGYILYVRPERYDEAAEALGV